MPTTRSFKPGPFRSVLCPVDFSDHSAGALKYAAVLARRGGGGLHVLSVNHPMLAAAAAVALTDPVLAATTLAELRTFAAKALPAGTRSAVSIQYAVETGEPARMIASAARRFRCDLIVMGSHGLSGVAKAFMGSTTERVLRRAALPVLVVPPNPPAEIGGRGPARAWPGSVILVPIDLRQPSVRDSRDARQLADAFGANVVLFHVVTQIQPPPWYRADLPAHWRLEVTKAQHQLESLAKRCCAGIGVTTRVVVGDLADEIAALAADERISLVVMHRRKGPGWFGSRAGSIASRVLRHAVTPVLVLPDGSIGRAAIARKRPRAVRRNRGSKIDQR